MRQRICALLLLAFVVAGITVKPASASARSSPPSPNRQFIEAFEKRLLVMFGLQSRPRPKRNHTVSGYMWELYKKQSKLQRSSRSNTIRCFKSQETAPTTNCDRQRARYQFEVDGIHPHEELWAAELVVYREHAPFENSIRPPVHRVQVFDVVRPATEHTDSLLRLLDTRVFKSGSEPSWESFDVLPAVQRWRLEPSHNYGLHVRVASSAGGNATRHVRLRRSTDEPRDRWSQLEPLLVTYSQDPELAAVPSRTKRSPRKHRRKGRRDNCRRHTLYVDFSDVGWTDWIIAPPGYNAYFCQGDCPFPLPDHLNATNHAIVQTIVNSVNPAAVPRACCVPTELSPISMLYKDKYDNVVLKNYQDMVVEGCGCR